VATKKGEREEREGKRDGKEGTEGMGEKHLPNKFLVTAQL